VIVGEPVKIFEPSTSQT